MDQGSFGYIRWVFEEVEEEEEKGQKTKFGQKN